MDLFVMIISYGLSSRFKQINDELERVKGEVNKIDYILSFISHSNINCFYCSICLKITGQCDDHNTVNCAISVLSSMMPSLS